MAVSVGEERPPERPSTAVAPSVLAIMHRAIHGSPGRRFPGGRPASRSTSTSSIGNGRSWRTYRCCHSGRWGEVTEATVLRRSLWVVSRDAHRVVDRADPVFDRSIRRVRPRRVGIDSRLRPGRKTLPGPDNEQRPVVGRGYAVSVRGNLEAGDVMRRADRLSTEKFTGLSPFLPTALTS